MGYYSLFSSIVAELRTRIRDKESLPIQTESVKSEIANLHEQLEHFEEKEQIDRISWEAVYG